MPEKDRPRPNPNVGRDEIEKLKNKLYSRGNTIKPHTDIRTPLMPREEGAPVAWPPPPSAPEPASTPIRPTSFEQNKKMSMSAKFFIVSFLFFIVALGVAAYMFFGGANIISQQHIDLQIIAPSLVDSGKEQTFEVLITNRNPVALELVDLVIDYPEGTRDPANSTKTLPHERQSIGTIAPGTQIKRSLRALYYGQAGSQQKVQATLEYSVAGSNAVFEKRTEADFLIGSSPVSVSIHAPSEAIAGETFPIEVTVQSNSTTPVTNVVVQAVYPFGFSFANSQPQAGAGGTFWQLGTLLPGSSQVIHLSGSIEGTDGDSRVFRFLAGSNSDPTDTKVKVPLLTVPETITVHKPFITGTISVNGQTGKNIAVSGGAPLQGTITWQNNLSTAVSDVQLSVVLSGPALDKTSVNTTTGFYQSQNSTITWTSTEDPSLAQVPPGGSGVLQFSFATLPAGANNTLITNPTISISLTVKGTRAGENNVPEQVASAASTQVSIASALSLTAQALHFSGPLPGTGPMPPKAESDTSYSIVWTVKNSSNPVANAAVSVVLPTYVRYVSAGSPGVSYDSGTRTVSWSLGDLSAGVGYTTAAKSVAFQVVLTPSTSQVGSVPQITGATMLNGQDRFANVNVQTTAQPLTTQLVGDSGFASGMEVVAPK